MTPSHPLPVFDIKKESPRRSLLILSQQTTRREAVFNQMTYLVIALPKNPFFLSNWKCFFSEIMIFLSACFLFPLKLVPSSWKFIFVRLFQI